MGYLDNEYGYIGDDQHFAPKYIMLLDELALAYQYGDEETVKLAQSNILEHFDWLEDMLDRAIKYGQDLNVDALDIELDDIETEFNDGR